MNYINKERKISVNLPFYKKNTTFKGLKITTYKSTIKAYLGSISNCLAVLRIRIRRICMFLGLLDPDPLVRGMDLDPAPDPDPSIAKQKL
jgi:hypothetical protein